MRQWTAFVIDVDYSPRDPGTDNWFCERTRYEKSDLKPGMPLRYKDPGGLFDRIKLLDVSDKGVLLEYRDGKYELNMKYPYGRLDEGGRDYTDFELNIYLVPEEVDGEDAEDAEELEELEEMDEDMLDEDLLDDDGRWDAYV